MQDAEMMIKTDNKEIAFFFIEISWLKKQAEYDIPPVF
jgi:hypothetical protein